MNQIGLVNKAGGKTRLVVARISTAQSWRIFFFIKLGGVSSLKDWVENSEKKSLETTT